MRLINISNEHATEKYFYILQIKHLCLQYERFKYKMFYYNMVRLKHA